MFDRVQIDILAKGPLHNVPSQIVAVLQRYGASETNVIVGRDDEPMWAAVFKPSTIRVVTWSAGPQQPTDIRSQVFRRNDVDVSARWHGGKLFDSAAFGDDNRDIASLTIRFPETADIHVREVAVTLNTQPLHADVMDAVRRFEVGRE